MALQHVLQTFTEGLHNHLMELCVHVCLCTGCNGLCAIVSFVYLFFLSCCSTRISKRILSVFFLSLSCRCGLRTVALNVVSSSRVATTLKLGPQRRNPHPPGRARAQRAAASSPLLPSPVLALPPPLPQPIMQASVAPLPLSVLSPQFGAQPFLQAPHPRPSPCRSPSLPQTPPACSAPSQARPAPPTPCPTTRPPATARATRLLLVLTSAEWTVAPIWPPCTLTTTLISSAPWRRRPCPHTPTTTSVSPQDITTTIITRPTVALAWPSILLTAWITRSKRPPPGSSTSTLQTVWTTKTKRPGGSKSCDLIFLNALHFHHLPVLIVCWV